MNGDVALRQTLHLLSGPVADELETGFRDPIGDTGEDGACEPPRRIDVGWVTVTPDEENGRRGRSDRVERLGRELERQGDPDDGHLPPRSGSTAADIPLSEDDDSVEGRPRRTLVAAPKRELAPAARAAVPPSSLARARPPTPKAGRSRQDLWSCGIAQRRDVLRHDLQMELHDIRLPLGRESHEAALAYARLRVSAAQGGRPRRAPTSQRARRTGPERSCEWMTSSTCAQRSRNTSSTGSSSAFAGREEQCRDESPAAPAAEPLLCRRDEHRGVARRVYRRGVGVGTSSFSQRRDSSRATSPARWRSSAERERLGGIRLFTVSPPAKERLALVPAMSDTRMCVPARGALEHSG